MKQSQKKINGNNARERLMAAGTALFAERGYAGTFIREIVARAGVTKPVLYYYFKSKEGMFYTILDGAAEQQKAILAEALKAPGTVLDRLIFLYRRIYEGLNENPNLFKMIHNLVFGPRQGTPEYDIEQYHHLMADTIKTIYLEGLAKGEVKETNADQVAILVLSLLDFCFHMEYVHPESSDPERPESLLRLAFQGLGTEPLR
jgi:TetR/AcrR family transcriptional regulator